MMDFYGMFDYQAGDTNVYEYTSNEFSALIGALCGNGVAYSFGNKLAQVGSPTGLIVTLNTGAVFINGRYGYNNTNTTLEFNGCAANTTRKDYIVADLDLINRNISIKIVEGTSADYPTLTENQICLYAVDLSNNGTNTVITSIADRRSYCYSRDYTPSASIIFSDTEPAVVQGAIWLKPIG